jgi:hypothetical protein
MKKLLLSLITGVCIFTAQHTYAQSKEVNVSTFTGAIDVVIPVYTFNSGQVSVPITLSYTGSGIKPSDVEETAGMGWQLNAGGQIARVVRGLPDDCTQDNLGHTLLGWMSTSNTAANYASNFTVNNTGTCTTGAIDVNNINTNIAYTSNAFEFDTEPDIFYLRAPGFNCELVYDRTSAKFHPINYKDLIIAYTLVGGTGKNASNIASFTITNDRGIQYTFAAPETVTQIAVAGSGPANYLISQYDRYNGGVTYFDSWNLTSIKDSYGNGVLFSYDVATVRNSTDPVELFIAGSTTPTVEYKIQQAVTPQVLSAITTANINNPSALYSYLGFAWNTPDVTKTGQTVIGVIEGMGRYFQFNYASVSSPTGGYKRQFLTSFNDKGCSSPINYQFSYIGVNPANGTTALADSTSIFVDYWGYYSGNEDVLPTLIPAMYVNPSNSSFPRYNIAASSTPGSAYTYSLYGNNRGMTASTVADGSLSTITYPQGGTTTITYEPNSYYDAPSGTTVQGGGIRVLQLVDNPGSGLGNSITRNYSYSGGQPLSLPQFAFTIPYSGTATLQSLWTNATALSAYDLSTDNHSIVYASTKVSQTGAGSTVYNYSIPATYWSTSATPTCNNCTTTEWQPTVNYAASSSCTINNGPIANLANSYPFIPNLNYDFERGLPLSIISYNDAGQEVSESDYTYQRSYPPLSISAFKYDYGPQGTGTAFYNKYKVFYNTSELTATVTKKIFDSSGSGTSQSTTTTLSYSSAYHKLLSQQQVMNSDNSIVTTHINYVKDYPTATASSNANVQALNMLGQKNINIPVETYQQVTRNGTTVTTAANLSLYAASTNGSVTNYLPSETLKWIQPNGGAFTPLTVTSSAVNYDGGYVGTINFDTYDNSGELLTADDTHKNYITTLNDFISNHSTAVFKNAQYKEVAFNDFDSQFATPVNTFTITGTGSFTPVGSHAGNAAGLATGQTVTSSTITKNALAQNYIFSIWINAATAGTLSFTGITANPISYLIGGWKYYEVKIPASALASTFSITLSSNQNISIDDILLYPDVAEVNTATYDALSHYKIAETNTNGVSSYYTNDTWGRVLFAFDQDQNIVQKNTYISAADVASFNPVISCNTTTSARVSNGFNITGPDICSEAGATVTWTFGDGATTTAALGVSVSHAYSQSGPETVNAIINSPLLGTKSAPPVTITVNPQIINLSYNNYTTSGGNVTSITLTNTGSGPSYSFTSSTFNGAQIQPGTYKILVYLVGGQKYNSSTHAGYSSVSLTADCTSTCSNFVSVNDPYSFTLNLATCTTLNLTISQLTCVALGGGPL